MIRMALFDSEARYIALSVAIAALMVSAGCNSLLNDSSSTPPTTERPNQQGTTTPVGANSSNLSANGTDLRSVTIPEEGSNPNTYYGEIDGDDSVTEDTNQYYESISFTAEAGDIINITMTSIANDPELQLRNPNGTTVAIDNNGGDGNNAAFELLTLNETGQYMLVASAAQPNTGFDYTLTVERYVDPNPELDEYNERQRLEEFANDYIVYAQFQSGGRDRYINESEDPQGNLSALNNRSVNVTTDEAVVGYFMEEDATTIERIDIDVSLMQAYTLMYESYIADDGSPENASWVPDRIYHVAYTYNGELYQVSYIERDWSVEYYERGGPDNSSALTDYGLLYYTTVRRGPAHPEYNEDSGTLSTDPENPLEVYANESEAIGSD